MPKPLFGLALGGGGARGLAHVPILKGLEKAGLRPSIITGTSMGALVAALYVQYGSADMVEIKLRDLLESEPFKRLGLNLINVKGRGGDGFWQQAAARMQDRIVVNLAQSKPGLVKLERIQDVIEYLIHEDIWDSGTTRLGVAATDLETGEDYHFKRGDLVKAVLASMAIPGFVPPLETDGRILVDGGVSQLLPVRLARELGAGFIMAVDVGKNIHTDAPLDNALAIMSQCEVITAVRYREYLMEEADYLLVPDFGDSHWSEFHRVEEFIQAGEDCFEFARKDLLHQWKRRSNPVLRLFKSRSVT